MVLIDLWFRFVHGMQVVDDGATRGYAKWTVGTRFGGSRGVVGSGLVSSCKDVDSLE